MSKPVRILLHPDDGPLDVWQQAFAALDPDVDCRIWPNWGGASDGPAYALLWRPPADILNETSGIKAIFSMGAGVDSLLKALKLPDHIPLYRLSDQALLDDMAEYVTMGVLMMHRRIPQFLAQQQQHIWQPHNHKPAATTRVGILGYGNMGMAAGERLKPFGYQLAGWCRRPRQHQPQDIKLFSGMEELDNFLAQSDILVCLLPHTAETKGLLNHDRLNRLPDGAAIINAGRGSLICLDALTAALDGTLGAAMLDVMPEEPFPADHPLWSRDDVIITPHIAATTRPASAAAYILKSIHALEAEETIAPQLDRRTGY